MKTKDIAILVIATVFIVGSGYLVYKILAPAKNNTQNIQTTQTQGDKFTGNIDETTLKMISGKKDYGEAALDNIGRTNPFGPLN